MLQQTFNLLGNIAKQSVGLVNAGLSATNCAIGLTNNAVSETVKEVESWFEPEKTEQEQSLERLININNPDYKPVKQPNHKLHLLIKELASQYEDLTKMGYDLNNPEHIKIILTAIANSEIK